MINHVPLFFIRYSLIFRSRSYHIFLYLHGIDIMDALLQIDCLLTTSFDHDDVISKVRLHEG